MPLLWQAPGEDSEVFLKPAFMCKDPMREGDHILVLCEMLLPDMTPIKESTRTMANIIFEQCPEEVCGLVYRLYLSRLVRR